MERKRGKRPGIAPPMAVVVAVLMMLLTVLSCHPEEPIHAPPHDTLTAEKRCDPDSIEAVLFPPDPAPGDFAVITVGPLPPDASVNVQLEFPGTLSPLHRGGDYTYFLLGLAFQAPPGDHRLLLSVEHPTGEHREIPVAMVISAPELDTLSFNMPAERTAGWTAQRLAEDRERVRRARSDTAPEPLWYQSFIPPLEGRISSPYGQVRIINQGAPSYHNGVDFAVPEGTPVRATNDGVARLADALLAHGNTVIIDHGLNLSSSYLHLETIAVTEGEQVVRGQVIGTAGETGFATGPHLHWEVNLGLMPVNPMQLVRGDLYRLPGRAVLHEPLPGSGG